MQKIYADAIRVLAADLIKAEVIHYLNICAADLKQKAAEQPKRKRRPFLLAAERIALMARYIEPK